MPMGKAVHQSQRGWELSLISSTQSACRFSNASWRMRRATGGGMWWKLQTMVRTSWSASGTRPASTGLGW